MRGRGVGGKRPPTSWTKRLRRRSVGVRCHEALLSLVRELSNPAMVPEGEAPPKAGDYVHWSERIAGHVVPGPSLENVRSHLRLTAKSVWDLAGWLTHAKNATRVDAKIAVEATSHSLSVFLTAVLAAERKERVRCPICGSYRVLPDYDPEARQNTGRALRCDACGYGQPEKPVRRSRRPGAMRASSCDQAGTSSAGPR